MSRTAIVIVARDPRGAKRRLRDVLTPGQREALSRAMLADVLAACRGTRADVLVVTESRVVARIARAAGAAVHRAEAKGTRACARIGTRVMAGRGASAVLVLPADLPLLRQADVRRLLAAGAREGVVVTADRHGRGTNALLLRPAGAMAALFGPASFTAHVNAACRGGLPLRTPRIAGVRLDVDTPDDLRLLRQKRRLAGPRTAAVLRALD
ncbi:MAG TPA: 2-phospho-L-lactate guanylyltransferase [Candidatus Saccharimonadales bacterium]|nr:2-phospho-L-lactate guanylyltransferase [Candidatus Saccharimonadales bacterium]